MGYTKRRLNESATHGYSHRAHGRSLEAAAFHPTAARSGPPAAIRVITNTPSHRVGGLREIPCIVEPGKFRVIRPLGRGGRSPLRIYRSRARVQPPAGIFGVVFYVLFIQRGRD